ncbi:response regulator [Heliophilum fasciatum]|uniref:Circadian input-output histidine kinase CikA n=1 Tax=Heliophilum fasciatum TaxID=35700 RepID=A0A4R2RUT8_9FIRM|nr:response regulator [Heliophilum fasciatum]MCW2278400.1 CheY-like chemotaxis protein [Heliophilum fasciatum]TCP63701.1 response regulator receiver domain-containing protein [Heliophilum fasciatum]
MRIRQILLNLAGNAVKFTNQGKVSLVATVAGSDDHHVLVRFEVRDTGIGLSDEAKQRLFQPFTQADGSTTRKYGGTGLGLSISKRLVEMMHGSIGVESELGHGSTFWVEIPLQRSDLEAEAPSPKKRLPDLRILLMGKNQGALEVIHQYLNAWEFTNAFAADAQEAWQLIQPQPSISAAYNLVIVEGETADEKELEQVEQLQRVPGLSDVKWILVTGFNDRTKGEHALRRGFHAYLPKPIKQSQLLEMIAKLASAAHHETTPPMVKEPANEPAKELVDQKEKPILLAEDNRANQKLAVLLLKKLGYRTVAVNNGLEAVEACANGDYALVLMDCQMPEMDGFEATRQIRLSEQNTGRHLPIVAMTANAMQGDQERCLASGMDDYISKPVNPEKLREVIPRWYQQSISNET